MRTYDDDEDFEKSWRGEQDDDSLDEYPDEADTNVEGGYVKCVHCGKYIHEEADMCARCHRWQTDEHHPPPKSRWYVWTVFYCVLVVVIFWIILEHWG